MSDKVVFKWNPKAEGDFFQGIPPRDLTEADLAVLSPLQLRDIVAVPEGAHRYYEPVNAKSLPPHLKLAEGAPATVAEPETVSSAPEPADVVIAETTKKG